MVTAREMLDEGAARVRTELQDAPPVQARLLTAMGGAYMGLRQDDVAERLLQDALSVRASIHADPDRQQFESLQHLSRIQARRGDAKAALTYSRRAAELAPRLEASPGRYHSEVWNNLGADPDADRRVRAGPPDTGEGPGPEPAPAARRSDPQGRADPPQPRQRALRAGPAR